MSSGHPAWKRLINNSPTSNEKLSLITEIFSNRDETDTVKRLQGDEAQSFVDAIDQVVPPVILKLNLSDMSVGAG